MGLRRLYKDIRGRIGYLYYTRIFTPYKVKQIRKKARIDVIFVITELGMWKTERLYLQMRAHSRFNPMIRVLPNVVNKLVVKDVLAYLEKKGYEYKYVEPNECLQKYGKADVIFYSKPYLWEFEKLHTFLKNKNALLAYVSYGFHNIKTDFICNQPLHNYCWQYYFENQPCAQDVSSIMENKGRNIKVTGVPMMDDFLLPRSSYRDLWKKQDRKKKRMIWAPHYSFSASNDHLRYSTFMEYANEMLGLAEKYKDHVQFLFKPHPLLLSKLYEFWGKEKTDAYYARWASMENTQIELGQYIDFFMTSDAMIHDCSSFTIEYLYACKPVMHLKRGAEGNQGENLNCFAKQAYELHYIGKNKQDIEAFIQEVVISGNDARKEERQAFYNEYLLPPNGKTACQNIIDAILGKEAEHWPFHPSGISLSESLAFERG